MSVILMCTSLLWPFPVPGTLLENQYLLPCPTDEVAGVWAKDVKSMIHPYMLKTVLEPSVRLVSLPGLGQSWPLPKAPFELYFLSLYRLYHPRHPLGSKAISCVPTFLFLPSSGPHFLLVGQKTCKVLNGTNRSVGRSPCLSSKAALVPLNILLKVYPKYACSCYSSVEWLICTQIWFWICRS